MTERGLGDRTVDRKHVWLLRPVIAACAGSGPVARALRGLRHTTRPVFPRLAHLATGFLSFPLTLVIICVPLEPSEESNHRILYVRVSYDTSYYGQVL